MYEIQMIKGAVKLLRDCASLKPEEEVLIVADYKMEKIAKALASATYHLGGEPILTYIVPRDRDGQEPPKAVAEAMKRAAVFMAPVSKSITHTTAVKKAVEAGARGLMLTQFSDDMLIYGGIEADFRSISPACEALAARFEEGSRLHMSTPVGTQLEASIVRRPGNAMTCLVKPGQFSPVPNVEANVSPVEGSANGKIVVDASVPYIGIGILDEPIEIQVKNGVIESIKGGTQADVLAGDLESYGDPNVYNIAEIGIGLNPHSRLTGRMLDDEGVLKTTHIGIGTNITLGGNVKAACHYDLLCWHPTLSIDGVVAIENGDLRL